LNSIEEDLGRRKSITDVDWRTLPRVSLNGTKEKLQPTWIEINKEDKKAL